MATLRLQFDNACQPAMAWIILGSHSTTEDGIHRLLSSCVNAGEIDFQVAQLKLELDAVAKKARTKFEATSKKLRRQAG